jgi:oxygen-dependent protoporphyrinogen oxidase
MRMPQLTWGDRARMAARIGQLAIRRGPGPFTIEDLAAADDGSTLAAWSQRQFGERGLEYVVRPLMDPLTGADPAQISAAFTIALLHQVTKTQLTVPQDGMGSIATWLLDGIDVRLSTPAKSIISSDDGVTIDTTTGPIDADAVIVATDVRRARGLLDRVVDPTIVEALVNVTPIPAHHVLLGYHNDPWPDAPYDLVVRAGRGMHHNYGALLNGRRAPRSVLAGAQTVSVYLDTAQTSGLDEQQIVTKATEAADQAFGRATPDFHKVFQMDVALIAPTPGHYQQMLQARDAMPQRIRLAGDFLTHSGIEGALLSGEHAARDLRRVPSHRPTTSRPRTDRPAKERRS